LETIKMTTKPKTHGGKRDGAGRPPAQPVLMAETGNSDPKIFLLALMNDPSQDMRLRSDAAKALMPFLHTKLGGAGKKENQAEAAKKVASGKFAASAPPVRLVR
jgi:phage terminase small subunit